MTVKAGIYRQEAQRYKEAGFLPVPLTYRMKKPAVEDWNIYLDGLPQNIFDYWMKWDRIADAQIGIGLGTKMGPDFVLVAVDVDAEDLIPYAIDAIGGAPCAKKGAKGLTIFCLATPDIKTRRIARTDAEGAKARKPTIEILCAGSHTVIPPSIHPDTGQPYKWTTARSLLDMLLDGYPIITPTVLDELEAICHHEGGKRIRDLHEMIWLGVGGGGDTHDVCHRAVASMVSRGWTDSAIHLRIERAKRDACRRAGEEYNWPQAQKTIQEWIDSAKAKGFALGKKGVGQPKIPLAREAADWMIAVLGGKDGVTCMQGALRQYKDGAWAAVDENALMAQAIKQFSTITDRIAREALRTAQSSLEVPAGSGDYTRICLSNGTLNIVTGELERWAPEHGLMHRLDFPWEETECPRYEEAIDRIFAGDTGAARCFEEFCGWTFVPNVAYKRALILEGPHDTGKTTLSLLLMALHDRSAVCTVPLPLLKEEYHRASLADKLLNVSSEQSRLDNIPDVYFKQFTGGDPIRARHPYGRPFEFYPTTRFLMITNEMPSTADASGATFERLMIVSCPNTIPEEHRIRNFQDTIRAERPGILRRWVSAYRALRERGTFLPSPEMKRRLAEYRMEQSPVQTWIEERTERLGEESKWTPGADLFADYDSWSQARRYRPISYTEWTRALNIAGLRSKNVWTGRGKPENSGTGTAVKGWPLRIRAGMEARF